MKVLGAYLSPPVSIKDRTIGGPLVMLNTCLTFRWPNKVPFDREARKPFGPSRLPAAHCTGEGVVGHGDAMIRPKGSGSALRYMWFLANSRLYLNSWFSDL
jgi:hypothetical protein